MPSNSVRRKRQSKSGHYSTKLDLKEFYPSRPDKARKGDYGRIILCGGSDNYAGCLAFNALAALRAGADLAIVVAPRRAADIVAGYSPDLITVPCDSPFPLPDVSIDSLQNADALAIGCGVVRTVESHKALIEIVRKCETPIVIDAEALHAIAPDPGCVSGKKVLLTPNAGEFQVLAGEPWPSNLERRKLAIETLAKKYGATVIVKGAPDLISDGERTVVDPNGSSYMTKGGYGDLLAGAAAAHLARGKSPFDSARIAAFLVGRAGELAASELGESTLASDVLRYFASAIRSR